jgi:hypothetical protein
VRLSLNIKHGHDRNNACSKCNFSSRQYLQSGSGCYLQICSASASLPRIKTVIGNDGAAVKRTAGLTM